MIAVLLSLFAVGGDLEVDLQEAWQRGARRPTVEAAELNAKAARADAGAAWLAAAAPTVGATWTTTERTRAIALDTPIGAFVQQPKSVAAAGARGEWPLLDPAALLFRAPAASASARAARHQADRVRQQQGAAAALAALDVAELEARVGALNELVTDLQQRLTQIEARVEAGQAVEVDRLRVMVALSDAQQGLSALQARGEAARWRLGWTVGLSEPVNVRFDGPLDLTIVPEAAPAAEERSDLRSLRESERAVNRSRASLAASALPSLRAWGQWSWTDNDSLVDKQWVEGGLEARWTPLAGGTRAAQFRASTARLRAIRAQREDAERGIGAERAGIVAQATAAAGQIEARDLAVAQAESALAQVNQRYRVGLVPLTDVLQVQGALAEQRAQATIARVELARAQVRWAVATERGL